MGLLSKFPVEEVHKYRLTYSNNEIVSDNRILMVADIKIRDSQTVRFANVHFDHRNDPAIRIRQSTETVDYLKKLSPPVILTGDLNAEPEKPEISEILASFSDTDTGGAFTFPADEPSKKLDYILVNKSHLKKIVEHEVINEPVASDHRPVVTTVVLKK